MAETLRKLKELRSRIVGSARSEGGRNLMLYLVFVAIAFVFWALMSLDNQVQRDFDVPLEIQDMPDSVTVISDLPSSLSVSVRAKGSQLLRFMFSSKTPALKVKFEPSMLRDNHLLLNRARLDARLRDYFGSGVVISAWRPETVNALITSLPGKKLPVEVNADITTDLQCTLSGPVRSLTDSVTVYSASDIPAVITHVVTVPVVKSGLKDSTRLDVKLEPIPGLKIEPSTVTVLIPIETLISRKRMIPVEVLNTPANTNVILFPSKVEISYLVPISAYNEEYPMKAYADYNAIAPGVSKLSLFLSTPGGAMRNVSMSLDSVEYVVEKNR